MPLPIGLFLFICVMCLAGAELYAAAIVGHRKEEEEDADATWW